MYHFAIIGLLALAAVKLVDYLDDAVDGVSRVKSLLTFGAAVGAVFALDYSVFEAWGVGVREDWIGTLVTGFMVAGLTVPWRALFGYLTHDKAEVDEVLSRHIRRAA